MPRRDRDDALHQEGVRRRGLGLQRDKSSRRQGGVCADDVLLHVAVYLTKRSSLLLEYTPTPWPSPRTGWRV